MAVLIFPFLTLELFRQLVDNVFQMFLGLEGFEGCAPGLLCSASLAASYSMWAWMFWSGPLLADEASSTSCRMPEEEWLLPCRGGREEVLQPEGTIPCFSTMLPLSAVTQVAPFFSVAHIPVLGARKTSGLVC